MLILLVVGLVLTTALALGWRALAAETTPRAANAVLLMLAGAGCAAWLVSEVSLDAGL